LYNGSEVLKGEKVSFNMSTNSELMKEGIQVIGPLNQLEINRIASIIATKLCTAFPEHNLDFTKLSNAISTLKMYVAKFPGDNSVAKYFYKNNSIYFSTQTDLSSLDTLAIHECIHFIQEVKSDTGRLVRMGLFKTGLFNSSGMAMNEAAVQFMASIASKTPFDSVHYFGMDFTTQSSEYYPILTSLIRQMSYFTGTYPLFHSTLFSDDIFKNTFIANSNPAAFEQISRYFDNILKFEEELTNVNNRMFIISNSPADAKRYNDLFHKAESLKKQILNTTLNAQNCIIKNCFDREFELVKDKESLKRFQKKIYNFKNLIIQTDNYEYYLEYYRSIMDELAIKSEIIKRYGVILYSEEAQKDLALAAKTQYNYTFLNMAINKFKELRYIVTEKIKQHNS